MVADPASVRLFVDESLMGLGKALAYARKDVVHTGHSLIPGAPVGALDTEWIPAVANAGFAVIARDRRIRTRTAELELLRQHGLRVFWIAGKRDLSTWGYLERLVRRWTDLEGILETRGPGPWFMAINENGIKEVVL
jgi:hypothetical protein